MQEAAIKIGRTQREIRALQHEGTILDKLKPLQGSIVPIKLAEGWLRSCNTVYFLATEFIEVSVVLPRLPPSVQIMLSRLAGRSITNLSNS